jgi:uncharacterized protein (TIGR00106 family)
MLVAFSVSPMGASESVGEAVAECVRIVRDSGLPHETNAMFTNIEGDWDEVMAVVRACVERAGEVAPRVSVTMKIDHRPGAEDQLRRKVETVRRHLDEA